MGSSLYFRTEWRASIASSSVISRFVLFLVSIGGAGRGGAAVEFDPVALQHAENGRAALVPADLPDVVHGVSGLVHVHDYLLPVHLQGRLGPLLALALQVPNDPALAPADLRGLLGNAADRVDDTACRRVGEEFVLRVDPVVYRHYPDPVGPAQVQEGAQLANAAHDVAQTGDDDLVVLLKEGQESSPLRTKPLLDTFLYDDALASEFLHPCDVFLTGLVALREEQVACLCHIEWGNVRSKLQRFSDNSNGT